jgi:expansin (peptidoglycan-binding protein)
MLYWITGFAFIALSACGRSDGGAVDAQETPPSSTLREEALETRSTGESGALTFGETHSGEASYYHANGKGNCGFDASDDLMVAALNTKDYASAAMCGAYVAVSGPAGTVTVRITDRCPGCKKGGLDLSRQAFARIAALTAGRVPVQWQIVEGPVSGPVTYHYKDGTSRYWTAIQPRNHRWPVAALDIKPKGASDWIRVERRAYNYFVHSKPIPVGPLRVRLTSLTAATVEDELPEPNGGILVHGAAQFE